MYAIFLSTEEIIITHLLVFNFCMKGMSSIGMKLHILFVLCADVNIGLSLEKRNTGSESVGTTY
jgi:hypothetical protein